MELLKFLLKVLISTLIVHINPLMVARHGCLFILLMLT